MAVAISKTAGRKIKASRSSRPKLSTVRMFGLDFNIETLASAAELIIADAMRRKRSLVITPNVDHIVSLSRQPQLLELYRSASYLFADGMPLVWFSKTLPSDSLPERVTGSDIFVEILRRSEGKSLSLAILGGEEGVGELASRKIEEEFPWVRVVGTYSPPFGFEKDDAENDRIVAMVNEWKPDILVLALGAPKQEQWAGRFMESLDCGPILCFGAAVDFFVGKVKRAPDLVQDIGLEWTWRLLQEPKRLWRRYLLKDPYFLVQSSREFYAQWTSRVLK